MKSAILNLSYKLIIQLELLQGCKAHFVTFASHLGHCPAQQSHIPIPCPANAVSLLLRETKMPQGAFLWAHAGLLLGLCFVQAKMEWPQPSCFVSTLICFTFFPNRNTLTENNFQGVSHRVHQECHCS